MKQITVVTALILKGKHNFICVIEHFCNVVTALILKVEAERKPALAG
jgi:hypothetical protein